jgi:small subunit ribosomal protein S16
VPVRIRLTRVGATKQPTYRFVVADSRNARSGRSIETLGHYNPRTDPIEIKVDEDKAKDWMKRGAQPSDTVARLFRRVGVMPEESAPAQRPARPPKKVRPEKAAKPAATEAAAEAPAAEAATEPAAEAVAEAPAVEAEPAAEPASAEAEPEKSAEPA